MASYVMLFNYTGQGRGNIKGTTKRAAQAHDWTLACKKYRESQEREPAPGTLLNLADCEEKRGELMAVFQLEDLTSSVEVMVFPRTMTEFGHLLNDDAVVVLRGRVDKRDDTPKFIPLEIEIFEPIESNGSAPLMLRLPPQSLWPDSGSRGSRAATTALCRAGRPTQ